MAVLAGAGLVKDAGLPMANELTERLRDRLLQETRDGSEKAKQLLSIYNFLSGGIRFQRGITNESPDGPIDVEEITGTAVALANRASDPLTPFSAAWHERLLEIEREGPVLQEFIDFILGRLEDWLSVSSASSLDYLKGLGRLATKSRELDIFSLNYDLCIEHALTELLRFRLVNGFSEWGWNPEVYDADVGVRLFKLHGSLDWVNDELYGICSLVFPRHPEAIELEGRRPLLIFGNASKLTGRDPFLTLLYEFSQRLDQTRILIIIGYSFGDPYLNEVIEQRLSSNPRLRLIVVAPEAWSSTDSLPSLQENPRVDFIDRPAKFAFEKGVLLRKVNDTLERTEDAEPF